MAPGRHTPAAWVRRRFPAQLAWLRCRIDPTTPDGLALTAELTAAALSAWMFCGLTQDVAAGEGTARLDPGVHAFAVAHRTGWLTAIMRNATWLGSSWVLVPALVAATVILLRGHRRRAGARPAAAQLWPGSSAPSRSMHSPSHSCTDPAHPQPT